MWVMVALPAVVFGALVFFSGGRARLPTGLVGRGLGKVGLAGGLSTAATARFAMRPCALSRIVPRGLCGQSGLLVWC